MADYVTVLDAMVDGHERLEVRCTTCRVTHHIPWRLMRGVLKADRLDELHKRLVCRKCGERPAPEDVCIPEPVRFPGGPLYGPSTKGV
ncbi:hypothetical protein ACFPOB_27715 [Bosea eneae]|uniref:Uncharacterized protein n=1 Tax=Bosea eneae TaxID=151454 RepID=A0ABW0J0W2_9HYPH